MRRSSTRTIEKRRACYLTRRILLAALSIGLASVACDSPIEPTPAPAETAAQPTAATVRASGASGAAGAAGAAGAVLTVGVVPQQAASRLARLWVPILAKLGAETGLQLVFKTAADIPTFERRVGAGEYDIAYMNPYHYTIFHESPGYEAFARRADKRIRGILVVRRGSAIDELQELGGEEIAFPAPRAFAATLLTRAGLDAAGIDYTPKFVSSHDSVYLNVAKGRFAVGGGIMRTFNSVDPAIRDQLEILWTTPRYTPHALAFHPRVPDPVRSKLVRAVTQLDDHDEGRALLQALDIESLEEASDEDWDDVRALNIEIR